MLTTVLLHWGLLGPLGAWRPGAPSARRLQAPPRLAFKPLSEPSLEELLQASDATAVTVVKFQAPWDRNSLDSMSAEVERVSEQWPGAAYYSVDLVRKQRV